MRHWINIGLFFVILTLFSSTVYAQDLFESLIEQGSIAYSKQNYKKAIIKFKAALEIKEHKDLYYNIARSYHSLDNCREAISNYIRYKELSGGKDEISKRIDHYMNELSDCYSSGIVEVTCSPPTTRVYVNYNDREYSCMHKMRLRAGNRKLTFEAPGLPSTTRMINVSNEKTTKLFVSLDGKTKAEASAERSEKKIDLPEYIEESTPNYLAGGLAITAAALGGTAIGLHLASGSPDDSVSSGLFYTAVGLDIAAVSLSLTTALLLFFDINPSAPTSPSMTQAMPVLHIGKNGLFVGASLNF